jgi:hypothetical protein
MTVDNSKPGRPTDYDSETGDTICERLGDGETLRKICVDPTMPDKATVSRWLAWHEEFRKDYARAHKAQFEDLLDETRAIVDDSGGDRVERA